jgi:hypothetical protein
VRLLALVAAALPLAGCATYILPANHLFTPEVVGPGRNGTVDVGVTGGTDLLSEATQPPTPLHGSTPSPELQTLPANFDVGMDFAITDKIDAGVSFAPYTPPLLRVKYQLTGEPEASAAAGNLAVALVGSGGIMLASGVTYYLLDAACVAGYRVWNHHLFSLTPFFSMAGLTGVDVPTTSGGGLVPDPAQATGGSASQYGVALGYQYDVKGLLFRLEEAYASGSYGKNTVGGLFTAGLIGLRI